MMTAELRQSIMQELQALPDDRLASVLEYVRFLKIQSLSDADISQRMDSALKTARTIAQQEGITSDDIEREIAEVRAGR